MMHIGCAAEERYAGHCAVMLNSLLLNNDPRRITVHFLHDEGISSASLQHLNDLASGHGAGFVAYAVSADWQARFAKIGRFGTLAWYRVLLPDFVKGADRILYLDADIVVRKDISALWDTDFQGHPLAAVFNPFYPYMSRDFLIQLELPEANYFNSGVLLMDARLWRDEDYLGRIMAAAASTSYLHLPDQNTLNLVFRDNWLPLELIWNAQNSFYELPARLVPKRYQGLDRARRDPAIVHYISHYKPTHFRCKHPFRGEYWRYLAGTSWQNTAMQGRTWMNWLIRLLPESLGWRVERRLRRWRVPFA